MVLEMYQRIAKILADQGYEVSWDNTSRFMSVRWKLSSDREQDSRFNPSDGCRTNLVLARECTSTSTRL